MPAAPPLKGKALYLARMMGQGQSGDDITSGWYSNMRASLDDVCPTITKQGDFMGCPKLVHPTEMRGLSSEEAALIQSFPPQFKIGGKWRDAWARIGNSVPPLMARAVAEEVRVGLGHVAEAPAVASTYAQSLEDAWAAHLAARAPDAPTVASLFAGCGGSSLGYSMAGFREVLAVEWDKHACQCFRDNFPEVPLYEGDIAQLSVDEALRMSGVAAGELDVLDGSPPCQGFSTSGRRQLDDPRNSLFKEYVRLLRGMRPRAFVMENVSGMVKGKMRLIFAEIMGELKASGYRVRARLLNAMYFGVPQSRERLIFIGFRDDLGIDPEHPKARTRPIPIRDVLTGLASPNLDGLPKLDDIHGKLWYVVPEGRNASYVTVDGGGFNNCIKPALDKPCPTICKSGRGRGVSTIVHPLEARPLAVAELMAIGAFPHGFTIRGKYSDVVARIGNSVPPLLARSVGEVVRSQLP